MKIGIIGYGSMGKMLAENFLAAGIADKDSLYLANRTLTKLQEMEGRAKICQSNTEVAASVDFLFLCVRPADIKIILEEIADSVRADVLVISLNGSVSFEEALFSCEFHSLFGLHPFSLLSRLRGSESIRNPRRRDDGSQQGPDRVPADVRRRASPLGRRRPGHKGD